MKDYRRHTALLVALALPVAALAAEETDSAEETEAAPRHVRALVITTFGPERSAWEQALSPTETIEVPGLFEHYPDVLCNDDNICLMTTGKGYANAATSVAALAYSQQFDLTESFFLIAGVAGVDPRHATLGSPTWPRYLIDFGIQWQLDARDIPPEWTTGYLSINTHTPAQDPHQEYETELYRLDEALVSRAVRLSKEVALADSDAAAAFRARYASAPGNRPPSVVQCDSASSDTWWYGDRLADRAAQLARQLTDGQARLCSAQQEDNAILTALSRADAAGRLSLERTAIVRAGASFYRPWEGLDDAEGLTGYAKQGGYQPALANMVRAGAPLIEAIATDWDAWREGVPPLEAGEASTAADDEREDDATESGAEESDSAEAGGDDTGS